MVRLGLLLSLVRKMSDEPTSAWQADLMRQSNEELLMAGLCVVGLVISFVTALVSFGFFRLAVRLFVTFLHRVVLQSLAHSKIREE